MLMMKQLLEWTKTRPLEVIGAFKLDPKRKAILSSSAFHSYWKDYISQMKFNKSSATTIVRTKVPRKAGRKNMVPAALFLGALVYP